MGIFYGGHGQLLLCQVAAVLAITGWAAVWITVLFGLLKYATPACLHTCTRTPARLLLHLLLGIVCAGVLCVAAAAVAVLGSCV